MIGGITEKFSILAFCFVLLSFDASVSEEVLLCFETEHEWFFGVEPPTASKS